MACSVSTDNLRAVNLGQATFDGSWCITGGGSSTVEFQWGYGSFSFITDSIPISNVSFPAEDCGTFQRQVTVSHDRTIQMKATSGACGQGGTLFALTRADDAIVNAGPFLGTSTQKTIPVSGTITPNTFDSTANVNIQYRVSGAPDWINGVTIAAGLSGSSQVPVAGTQTGLVPGTTYELRLRITRTVSTSSLQEQFSGVVVFSTQPNQLVFTFDATNVGPSVATLNGVVNPLSDQNVLFAQFEYGTTPAFGLVTTLQGPYSGTGAQTQLIQVTNLTGSTHYFFRLKGYTSEVTVFGDTLEFTTVSADPAISLI